MELYFFERNEKWFGLILNHKFQGKGNCSLLMALIKSKNDSLNGWVSDGEKEIKQKASFYKSLMQFYLKKGFTIIP